MFSQIGSLLIETAAGFFVFLLLARFHFQWLRVPFRNQIGEFLVAATNWIVRPARRVVPPLGSLDLATWIAAWLVQGCAVYVLLSMRGWEAGASPGSAFAGVVAVAFVDLLRYSLYILLFALIVRVVLSWVNPHAALTPLFDAITRPFVRPVQRFIPPIANVDLSPLVLFILIQVLLIPVAHLRTVAGALL